MVIKIYKLDASPPARAVLMIADILKLKHELVEVNVLAGDQLKPEYLEKNPLHTIPLLEDGDFVLADSHAIITYLVSKYGAEQRATLYPSELSLRATIDQRLFYDASIAFPQVRAIVGGVLKESLPAPTPQHIENVNFAYDALDKYLQKTKFVACNHLTLADVSCVSTVSSLASLVPVDDKYTKLRAWLNALKDEEWYQNANQLGLSKFEGFMKAAMSKNSGSA